MNYKARFIGGIIGILISGIYVTFYSGPAHKKMEAHLQSATTNEVVTALGQPLKQVAAETFNARAKELAQEGYPVSNADTTAKGFVWLYLDGGNTPGVHRYMTVIFDQTSHVTGVYSTFWVKDI
jgi:hypothetical protein